MSAKQILNSLEILLRPIKRAQAIRRDESGQVMLLTGVMAFLIAIMSLVTLDTGKAIHNRITAQNAADAAADAAALWQARGCNMLQSLNNLHRKGNTVAYVAEVASLAVCVTAAALKATLFFYGAGEALCPLCRLAPNIDKAQYEFAELILKTQDVMAKSIPYLAFGHANAAAEGCGADRIVEVVPDYALELFGINNTFVGDMMDDASDMLDINIFTIPLDPKFLKPLAEKKEADDYDLPWHFPETAAQIPARVGQIACSLNYGGRGGDWGWKDSYFWGNPGFSTWIAGKKEQDELAGLGKLIWMRPDERTYQQMVDTHSKTLYSGPIDGGSTFDELVIPAVMAIASSHVEGEPVVSDGEPDATPHLITVHFPPDSDPTAATKFLIFH